VNNFSDKITAATKMPFQHISLRNNNQVFIGETEFANPEKEEDVIKLYIYLAAPKFKVETLQVSLFAF
jgi:hypothetical protein